MINSSSFFKKELMKWYASNARVLPWKNTKDPYVIWLSEIILQQTRVAQGTPYFNKFIKTFPTIDALANASSDKIMNLWEGLGYYSRARNMHHTARYISEELDGVFPTNHKDILQLKGVGPYTAAAICSFAYDQVYPVIDGNVIRLLARYYGITDFVDDTAILKYIKELAENCIDKDQPAQYNQAIMDFGSLVCSPKSPTCDNCPLSPKCQAYQFDKVSSIPVKGKKIKKTNRYFHYLVIRDKEHIILHKREKKDIWLDLYQYPMIEQDNIETLAEEKIKRYLTNIDIDTYKEIIVDNNIQKQVLTHQNITAKFYHISVNECLKEKSSPYYLVNTKNLDNFAFPKIVIAYQI